MRMSPFVITATDTDVGKTVFAAALMLAFEEAGYTPTYWKPVQSGIGKDAVDTRTIQNLTTLSDDHFLRETYIFTNPLSPHRAAELDNTAIDIDRLEIPRIDGPLMIEGAGGLHVPLTRSVLYSDVFAIWKLPVVLCARTALGTLNHTLLSLEALHHRNIPVLGVAFIGEENDDNIQTIADFSNVRILGRLPIIHDLNRQNLLRAFHAHFDLDRFIL
jgi:dethiobiotin synthetase